MIGIRDRSKGHFKNGNKDFRGDFWFFFFLFLIFSFSGIIALLHGTFFLRRVPHPMACRASQVALVVKSLPVDTRDSGSIPVLGRSPGGGNGNPLQYSCLKNPVDRGGWQFTVHGVAKSQTQLSNWACTGMQVLSSLTEDGTQAPCSGSAES